MNQIRDSTKLETKKLYLKKFKNNSINSILILSGQNPYQDTENHVFMYVHWWWC